MPPDVIADHDRRHGGEILLVEIGDLLVPALLAGPRVERDQVIVRRFHVQPVALHAEAAIADVRAALGLPEVVPEVVAVARVDRPGVVGRGEVEDAVDLQNRRADVGVAAADRRVARAFAADDGRRAPLPKPSAAARRRRPARR